MQAYESVFWAMAIVVLAALAGGAVVGCFRRRRNSLIGVSLQSCVTTIVVACLATRGPAADITTLLAVAAFLFSLVIGTAAALLTHRVRGHRTMHRG